MPKIEVRTVDSRATALIAIRACFTAGCLEVP